MDTWAAGMDGACFACWDCALPAPAAGARTACCYCHFLPPLRLGNHTGRHFHPSMYPFIQSFSVAAAGPAGGDTTPWRSLAEELGAGLPYAPPTPDLSEGDFLGPGAAPPPPPLEPSFRQLEVRRGAFVCLFLLGGSLVWIQNDPAPRKSEGWVRGGASVLHWA